MNEIDDSKITFCIPLKNSQTHTEITIDCARKSAKQLLGMVVDYYGEMKYNIISVDVKDGYIWVEAEKKEELDV